MGIINQFGVYSRGLSLLHVLKCALKVNLTEIVMTFYSTKTTHIYCCNCSKSISNCIVFDYCAKSEGHIVREVKLNTVHAV